MAYYLTNLLQDAYLRLGQTAWLDVATGGSTTTFVDTKLGDDFADDDLKNGTLFVVRDAGGSGAAPEGEFASITSYTESTYTVTIGSTLSAAIAAGDICLLTLPLFPLRTMVELANIAVKSLGSIALCDTSITTAANQTEYTYPVALKSQPPIKAQIQTYTTDANDNQWVDFHNYYITPAAPGTTGLFVMTSQPDSGYNIKLWYMGLHPTLTVYNSVISETIHPDLITTVLVERAHEWYNRRIGGGNDAWMQSWNKAMDDVRLAKNAHPIWRPPRIPPALTWSRSYTADEDEGVPDPVSPP